MDFPLKMRWPLILLTVFASCKRDGGGERVVLPEPQIREEAILGGEESVNFEPDREDLEESSYTFTLEEAINRALTFNRKLVGALDQVSKAKLNLDYSGSDFELKIVPRNRLSLREGTEDHSYGEFRAGIEFKKQLEVGTRLSIEPSLSKTGRSRDANLRFALTQPLFRGFGREYNISPIKTAEFNYRSSCRMFYSAEVALIVNVVSTAYDLIKMEQTVLLNEESYERLQTYLASALIKEKIGLADSLDVYRAEMELKQAEEILLGSRNQLLDVRDRFKDLLALPLDAAVALDLSLEFREDDFPLAEAIETALEKRVEIDQAKDRLRENIRLSKRAEDGLLPDLNLNFEYDLKKNSWINGANHQREHKNSHGWNFGLSNSGDIERSKEHLAYRQSLLAIEAAERDLSQAKDTVVLEIRRTLRQLTLAKAKKGKVQEVIQNAEGKLHLSQLKFEKGMANNFDVLQAEKSSGWPASASCRALSTRSSMNINSMLPWVFWQISRRSDE